MSHSFCFKWGFIPWICTSHSGSNTLSVRSKLYDAAGGVARDSGVISRSNVTSVDFKKYSMQFIIKDAVPGTPAAWVGACGRHSGDVVGDVGQTVDGTVNALTCP